VQLVEPREEPSAGPVLLAEHDAAADVQQLRTGALHLALRVDERIEVRPLDPPRVAPALAALAHAEEVVVALRACVAAGAGAVEDDGVTGVVGAEDLDEAGEEGVGRHEGHPPS
jgi:hypothetical protein